MWKRVVGATLFVVCAGVAGGFGYLSLRQPRAAPPRTVQVPMTPETIERGRYIFQVLADCDGCHSERDFTRFGGPVVQRGIGTEFPADMGMPGRVVASNITPDVETGLGGWTDGEKIRAIREGIGKDGRALFPMMPYRNFKNMSDADVEALVAYMNSLPAVENRLPKSEIEFPVSLLIKSVPEPAGVVPEPDHANSLAFGKYLAMLGGCAGCHTPSDRGEPIASRELAGGQVFRFNGMLVVSPNITPDPETGLGKLSDDQFVKRFHDYRQYSEDGPPEVSASSFTLMPWLAYSRMSEEELKAIFAYLKTRKPVVNLVDTHPETN